MARGLLTRARACVWVCSCAVGVGEFYYRDLREGERDEEIESLFELLCRWFASGRTTGGMGGCGEKRRLTVMCPCARTRRSVYRARANEFGGCEVARARDAVGNS